MTTVETVTEQQEIAYQQYTQQKEVYTPFWEWYGNWCYENSLYNDRASYQIDEIENYVP